MQRLINFIRRTVNMTGSISGGGGGGVELIPKINIASGGTTVLNKDLFQANAADISYKSKASNNKKRNLTTQPFLGLVQGLGFTGFFYPSIGSLSSYTHATVTGVGNGYNALSSDFDGTGDDYLTFDDGVNTNSWGVGFDKDLKTLTDASGVTFNLCFNPPNGTLSELQTYMTNFNCKCVAFGAELPGQVTAAQYLTWVNPWISYLRTNHPTTQIILDAGLVYKNIQSSIDFNVGIMNADADQARYYMQVNDRLDKEDVAFSADMNANLTALNNLFSSYLPTDLDTFRSQLPNFGMSVGQIQLEDNRGGTQYVNNTTLGCWAIGKIFEFIIKNQDLIKSASWESLKNLIDNHDITDYNYAVFKQIGSMFSGAVKYVQTISFDNMDVGVTGICVKDDSNNYYILVNNNTSKTFNPSIYIDGIRLNLSTYVTIQRMYASTLSDLPIGDIVSLLTPTVSPYSTSVYNFKA